MVFYSNIVYKQLLREVFLVCEVGEGTQQAPLNLPALINLPKTLTCSMTPSEAEPLCQPQFPRL